MLKSERQRAVAAAQVASFAGDATKKRAFKGTSKTAIARTRAEAERMRLERSWGDAKPGHLVALYAWCHEQVYGVAPAELSGLDWSGAAAMAAKLVRDEFGGKMAEVIEFMRWLWRREKAREKWRRDNDREGGRISWRTQFKGGACVTDYRIDKARRK